VQRHIPPTQLFIDLLNEHIDHDVWLAHETLFSEIGAWGMNSMILEMLFDYWAEREGRVILTPAQLEMARGLVCNEFVGTLDELVQIAPMLVDDRVFMD
jgi:hypothetical protein